MRIKQIKYHLALLLFFGVVYVSIAQKKQSPVLKKNNFRVGLADSYLQALDLQVSSKTYHGIRKSLQLEYLRKKDEGIFTANLNVFVGNLTPTSGTSLTFYAKEEDIYGTETDESMTLEISPMGFNLEVGYLYKLQTLAITRTALYLGGSLEENLTFTPGFLPIGLINYGSLNTKTRFDYILKNGKPLILQLSIPVLSVVTRLPYHNSPNIPGKSGLGAFFTGNNDIQTINHFQNIRFSVRYDWLVTKRMVFDVAYEAAWLHYNKPQHLTQVGSQLSLGLTF